MNQKSKVIKAGYGKSLPIIRNIDAMEARIKDHKLGQEWLRYRYTKEMLDFWTVQAGHAYTNLPVEALRAKGGFWSKKVFGKDMAYWGGHLAQVIPPLAIKLGKGNANR